MKKFLCAMVCAWACASLAHGQQASKVNGTKPAAAAKDDTERIVLDVNRVGILFTVTDKKGRFITDLSKDDFEVYEGKRSQQIVEFAAEADLPLRLAVVIDTSNSIRDRFKFQQEAAIEFINSVMRPEDKATVISFDTGPQVVADLTSDTGKLAQAIRELRPGGGTALYDAVYMASRDKLMFDQPLHKYRRAIIILSDGEDTQSNYTRDQALELAHRADAAIYSISTNISGTKIDGDKVLRYYAEETGGLTFFPFKVQDLAQSFENIANELRHQYSILYRPDPPSRDGQFHEVSIRIRERKGLVVRARKGYYAAKE